MPKEYELYYKEDLRKNDDKLIKDFQIKTGDYILMKKIEKIEILPVKFFNLFILINIGNLITIKIF